LAVGYSGQNVGHVINTSRVRLRLCTGGLVLGWVTIWGQVKLNHLSM